MWEASQRFDKNVRDALTFLEYASERVRYALPSGAM
jgi:hypothetical protein